MPTLLCSDKFPALLALILAITGWAFLRVIDSLATVPLIEYSISKTTDGDAKSIELAVSNLSGTKDFSNLAIKLRKSGGSGKFVKSTTTCNSDIKYVPPADVSSKGSAQVDLDQNGVVFHIQRLQPWGQLKLISCVAGEFMATVAIQSDNHQTVVLRPSGLLTFAVANEISILLIISGLGVLSILWYGSKAMQPRHSANNVPPSPAGAGAGAGAGAKNRQPPDEHKSPPKPSA